MPKQFRRGYKYLLLYLTDAPKSARLIGSHDGIDWDPISDTCIAAGFTPDTHGSIVWDPRLECFAWFTRATNLYRDRGARRKVARLQHENLWDEWPIRSENILLPDQLEVLILLPNTLLHEAFKNAPGIQTPICNSSQPFCVRTRFPEQHVIHQS